MIFLEYICKFTSIPSKDLVLIVNGNIEGFGSHAWAKVGHFHVDLTGDQFGEEPIVISETDPWLKYGYTADELPWEELGINPRYKEFLDKITDYIKEKNDNRLIDESS